MVKNWFAKALGTFKIFHTAKSSKSGRLIKSEKQKDIIIKYDQDKLSLVLTTKGGFATQLSATDLKCTWSNRAYFGGGKPVDITSLQLSAGEFTINNIDANHYHRIKDILPHLTFELKGEIAGLLNGQIALHRAGPFIKKCPLPPKDSGESSTTSFRIINFHTKEVLATYSSWNIRRLKSDVIGVINISSRFSSPVFNFKKHFEIEDNEPGAFAETEKRRYSFYQLMPFAR